MVTLLHIKFQQNQQVENSLFDYIFSCGGAGVDLFFIISGFIMVYTTRDSDGSLGYLAIYTIKRLSRIWPVYVILTLIYCVTTILIHQVTQTNISFTTMDLLKSLIFYPIDVVDGQPPFIGSAVLNPGWTLNYEIYFYTIFGISMLFKKFRYIVLASWLVFTILIMPTFKGFYPTLNDAFNYGWFSYLNLVTSPLILDFAAGIIIASIYFSKIEIKNLNLIKYLCSFSICFVVWALISKLKYSSGILGYGMPLFFLVLIFAVSHKTVQFNIPKSLIWLGDISFSLYLIHPIIIEPIFEIMSTSRSIRDPSFVPLLVCLSIGAAAVSHKYLEKKMCNSIRTWALSKIQKPVNTSRI